MRYHELLIESKRFNETWNYKRLEKWALNKHNVYLTLEQTPIKNIWILYGIERGEKSKKGAGQKVIKELFNNADIHNITILIWPENERLKKYYQDLGFVPFTRVPIPELNYLGRNGMIRKPHNKTT